jgi:hypothetical protein
MKAAMPREAANGSVPADHGLASLGLIMQLAGSVAAAGVALATFLLVFATHGRAPDGTLWMVAIFALAVTRSMYHRLAGTEILYGRRTNGDVPAKASPFAGVRNYIIAAVIQTAITAVILSTRMHTPLSSLVGISLGMLVWPAILGVVISMPRFRRLAQIPAGEDKGFEGAAILMTVLGVCGAGGTALVLLVLLDNGPLLSQGPGVIMTLAIGMLLVRSVLHVQAGLSGLRETSVDHAVDRANRYASFGVISAFCAAGGLLLVFMTTRLDLGAMSAVVALGWLLTVWPLVVRRFFGDRQFADVLSANQPTVHLRAPDAGLTGLGWLLIGHAAFLAMAVLPALIGGPDRHGGMFALGETTLSNRSIWWHVGLVTLELWAGLELVKMSPYRKMIGIAYGVIGLGVTVYAHWDALAALRKLDNAWRDPEAFLMFVSTTTIQIVLPVATVLLVLRQIAPRARARFRARPSHPAAAAEPPTPTSGS